MSAGSLSGEIMVTFFAAASCLAPAITRATVPFGVRVPPERANAPVIRQQRRAYYGRTAVIGACCIALILAAVAFRVGQGGSRLPGGGRGGYGPAPGVDRDDDRFWKAGLIYVNRDDPAIMIGARFGVGWTFNLANPMAWLILAGIVAAPAGLAIITTLAGLAEAELPGRGQVEAGRNGLDGLVEALQKRDAAALPAAMDPVTAGDGEGRDGQFHHQVQPQVFGVEPELAGQAVHHLALDPVPVVLDVFEQVGRRDYE
jgi:hypothetical protein